MLRLLRSKKGQNTAEYAILIALVIGVFSAMQIYVRRAVQARIKGGADNIPKVVLGQAAADGVDANVMGNLTQYDPYYVREGKYDMTTTSSEGEDKGMVTDKGGIRDLSNATTKRTGESTMKGAKQD